MSTDKAKGFPYLCGARTPACSVPLLGTLLVDRRASTRVSMRHAGVRAPRRLVAQSDSLAVPECRLTSGGLRLISALRGGCKSACPEITVPVRKDRSLTGCPPGPLRIGFRAATVRERLERLFP